MIWTLIPAVSAGSAALSVALERPRAPIYLQTGATTEAPWQPGDDFGASRLEALRYERVPVLAARLTAGGGPLRPALELSWQRSLWVSGYDRGAYDFEVRHSALAAVGGVEYAPLPGRLSPTLEAGLGLSRVRYREDALYPSAEHWSDGGGAGRPHTDAPDAAYDEATYGLRAQLGAGLRLLLGARWALEVSGRLRGDWHPSAADLTIETVSSASIDSPGAVAPVCADLQPTGAATSLALRVRLEL
jgi:hypothetical protein